MGFTPNPIFRKIFKYTLYNLLHASVSQTSVLINQKFFLTFTTIAGARRPATRAGWTKAMRNILSYLHKLSTQRASNNKFGNAEKNTFRNNFCGTKSQSCKYGICPQHIYSTFSGWCCLVRKSAATWRKKSSSQIEHPKMTFVAAGHYSILYRWQDHTSGAHICNNKFVARQEEQKKHGNTGKWNAKLQWGWKMQTKKRV